MLKKKLDAKEKEGQLQKVVKNLKGITRKQSDFMFCLTIKCSINRTVIEAAPAIFGILQALYQYLACPVNTNNVLLEKYLEKSLKFAKTCPVNQSCFVYDHAIFTYEKFKMASNILCITVFTLILCRNRICYAIFFVFRYINPIPATVSTAVNIRTTSLTYCWRTVFKWKLQQQSEIKSSLCKYL